MNIRKWLEKAYNWYGELLYCIPKGHSIPPMLITWRITYRCNLRCKMCFRYGEKGTTQEISKKESKNELNTKEIKKVIDSIYKTYRFLPYKPLIGVTGGEPFMRKDIFDVLEYMKSKGFRFAVTSNFALLNEEKVKRLVKLKPSDIRVSIDGPKEIHDKIRCVKGTFDRAVNNLLLVKKINKKIPIRINCTISETNVDYLEEMVPLAKKLNAHLNFQHLMFLNKMLLKAHERVTEKFLGKAIQRNTTMLSLSEKSVEKLINRIRNIKKMAGEMNVKLTFLPDLREDEIRDYYLDLIRYRRSRTCNFPWSSVRITYEGKLFACMDYFYGNLKEKGFGELWNNKKARLFRKTLKKIGLFPGCARCCKI